MLQAVCEYYSRPDLPGRTVTARVLESPESCWPVAEARGMLIYLWYRECNYSTYKIALLLVRNQSTIWRLHSQVLSLLAQNDYETQLVLGSLLAKIERIKEEAGDKERRDYGEAPLTA